MSDSISLYVRRVSEQMQRDAASLRQAIVTLNSLGIVEQKAEQSLCEAAKELRHVADILDAATKQILENA